MLFYDSIGPNPKVVRMFMAERGISGIPSETVDLRGGENRREPHLSRNPAGQCPALALDNGLVIAEITAICEYLDEIGPAGSTLIGKCPFGNFVSLQSRLGAGPCATWNPSIRWLSSIREVWNVDPGEPLPLRPWPSALSLRPDRRGVG
jgi:hypothetical protein